MARSVAPERARNFATIVYPDSAPVNWQTIISELCVPCFISPFHDSDLNPTGEPKKPHFHVLFMFDGKKSIAQVKALFDTFSGVGVEVVQSARGYARYLCHLDNPEKHLYDVADVISFGGADYNDVIGLPVDNLKAVGEMMSFCDDNDIIAFCDLLRYSRDFRPDWFRVLVSSSTLVMREYIKSRAWVNECNKSVE